MSESSLWLHTVHMTTFNVLPIVSWATVNMDWEQHIFGDGTEFADC